MLNIYFIVTYVQSIQILTVDQKEGFVCTEEELSIATVVDNSSNEVDCDQSCIHIVT